MALGSPPQTVIKVSNMLDVAVAESWFLVLQETNDGFFGTSWGIKIVVPFFTVCLYDCCTIVFSPSLSCSLLSLD